MFARKRRVYLLAAYPSFPYERQTTTVGYYAPYCLRTVCLGSLTSYRIYMCKGVVGLGLLFIVLIREDQKVWPFADVFTKAALSPKFFNYPACWSSRGLNSDLTQQPPARQTGAYPIELTGRRFTLLTRFLRDNVITFLPKRLFAKQEKLTFL